MHIDYLNFSFKKSLTLTPRALCRPRTDQDDQDDQEDQDEQNQATPPTTKQSYRNQNKMNS